MWRAESSGAVATQSFVDGWPLWACLTGNRCVSSEDEGLADKHYWRTSAACHNTGRAGAAPHPSATPENRCVGGSILHWRARSPITHPGDAGYGVHVWSRHLPASARPEPPLADRRENAPAHLKNASGRARSLSLTLTPPPTHTTHATNVTCSGASKTPHPLQTTVREADVALMLDPSLADERRLVVA